MFYTADLLAADHQAELLREADAARRASLVRGARRSAWSLFLSRLAGLLRRVAGAGIAVLIATRDAEAIASLGGIDRIVRLRAGRIVRDRPTSGPRPLVPPPSLTGTPARRRVRRITTLARGAEPTIPRVAEERPPV